MKQGKEEETASPSSTPSLTTGQAPPTIFTPNQVLNKEASRLGKGSNEKERGKLTLNFPERVQNLYYKYMVSGQWSPILTGFVCGGLSFYVGFLK